MAPFDVNKSIPHYPYISVSGPVGMYDIAWAVISHRSMLVNYGNVNLEYKISLEYKIF